MIKNVMGFEYNDEDYMSVHMFGDYLRKVSLYIKECDKKWEFICSIDDAQNKTHIDAKCYAKVLELHSNDIIKYIHEHPYDIFIV